MCGTALDPALARATPKKTTCRKCLAIRDEQRKAHAKERHRPVDPNRASASFTMAEVEIFNAVFAGLMTRRDVTVMIERQDFRKLAARFRAMAKRHAPADVVLRRTR